jgi:hypothetical protein
MTNAECGANKMICQGNKVITTRREVERFNAMWPNSSLSPLRHFWFEFDSQSGDLIDCDVPYEQDGEAAAAMAEDCKAYLLEGIEPLWKE